VLVAVLSPTMPLLGNPPEFASLSSGRRPAQDPAILIRFGEAVGKMPYVATVLPG
jgi:hypothetical protein